MDTIANSKRSQSGSGVGSSSADDVESRLPNGDIFAKNKQQHNDNNLAPSGLPYQLNSVIDQIGDVFISVLDIKKTFNSSLENPTIKKEHMEVISHIDGELDTVNTILADLTIKIDLLQLKG